MRNRILMGFLAVIGVLFVVTTFELDSKVSTMIYGNPVVSVASVDQYDQSIAKSTVPVLVYFKTTWCPNCKVVAPQVTQISREFKGKLLVLEVDIDANPALAERFNVEYIPQLKVFAPGKSDAPIAETDAFRAVAQFRDWLNTVVK